MGRLQQMKIISAAYSTLSGAEPWLPPSNSCLPALLALHDIQKVISETQDTIASICTQLKTVRGVLVQEAKGLAESELLRTKFETRLKSVRQDAAQRAWQTPDEVAQVVLATERKQAQHYKREHKSVTATLSRFVDSQLAPLIAAEELGGPVAGTAIDISEDVLAAGYTVKGKQNKAQKKLSNDSRQRRINQMFNSADTVAEDVDNEDEEHDTELSKAKNATQDLLHQLIEMSIDHDNSRYIALEKENAASRFLVRAKVAVLHPKDAKKLKLVDFAKTFHD